MIIREKYNLSFINRTVNGRNDKEIVGPDFSVLYNPLSYYVYLAGHYQAIEEILIDIDKALSGESMYDGIEVGKERILLTSTITTIISDGQSQSLPTQDLKLLLLEYMHFLNTKPLNGERV